MKKIINALTLLVLLISSGHTKQPLGDFKEMEHGWNSYDQAVSKTALALAEERLEDFEYSHVDPLCCCNDTILEIFLSLARKESFHINPATDLLIYAIKTKTEEVEQKIYQTENLRYANGIYSYSDKKRRAYYNIPLDTSGECKPLNFNNPEDREWYQENIIDKFETSGGNYSQAGYSSNAFGRYQFMPDTAAQYCQSAPTELGCCGGSYTLNNGSTTTGGEWRTGVNAEACQDAMFSAFTADNTNSLDGKGIPVNSCTVYLAHQQGIGGLMWLMGGNLPTSFAIMKDRVIKNVGAQAIANAVANGIDMDTEEGLITVYQDFWGDQLGVSDLATSMGSAGAGNSSKTSMGDFLAQAEGFNNLDRKKHYRKGILFELYREVEEIKNIYRKDTYK